MSVIVGIKKNGVFYLGADTQSTSGDFITRTNSKEEYKIKNMGNGLLCCTVGACKVSINICAHEELFVLPKGGLTKKFVVEEFAPKVLEIVKDENLVEQMKEGKPYIDCSFALVHKGKCILLKSDLSVWEVADTFSLGSGKAMAFPTLELSDKKQDVKEILFSAMKNVATFINSVSAPYIFIDSKNLEYEIIGG